MTIEEIIKMIRNGGVLCIAKEKNKNPSYIINQKQNSGTFLNNWQVEQVLQLLPGLNINSEWGDEEARKIYDIYRMVM